MTLGTTLVSLVERRRGRHAEKILRLSVQFSRGQSIVLAYLASGVGAPGDSSSFCTAYATGTYGNRP